MEQLQNLKMPIGSSHIHSNLSARFALPTEKLYDRKLTLFRSMICHSITKIRKLLMFQ